MRKRFSIAKSVTVFVLLMTGCLGDKYEKQNKELLELISPVPIPVSTTNTDAAEPAIAIAKDGSTLVVWVEHRPGGQSDIYLRKISANSSGSTPVVRVNPVAGLATSWRGDPPSIAVAPDGAIFVVWTGRIAEKGHENNLNLSVSRDGGIAFESPVKINDDKKPTVHGMHSLAISNQGRVYILWLDERNISPAAPTQKHRGDANAMEANREVFIAWSEDGGRTISPNHVIARDACPCCKTALTTSTDGTVYAGWRQVLKGDLRHIAVASSSDNGRTFLQPSIVSDDKWVIAGCPVSGPALSAGANGAVRVLWYTKGTAGTEGLYYARSTDSGRTFSPRQLVSGGAVFGNPLLIPIANGNRDIAVWQAGDSGLMRAELNYDSETQGAASLVTTGKLPSGALANGRVVLAYISSINNQRSIWLVAIAQIESTAKV